MRQVISAVAAATVLLAGSPSVARTISVATVSGDWNDNQVYRSWTAKIEFDPTLGVVTPFEDGYDLHWDSSMAGPAPVLDAGVILNKFSAIRPGAERNPILSEEYYYAPTQFEFSDFTSFSLKVSTYHYLFTVEGANFSLLVGEGNYHDGYTGPGTTGHFDQSPIFAPGGVPQPDQAVSFGYAILGDYGNLDLPGAPIAGGQDNRTVVVERVAVPEPATWALMFVGFGSLGQLLRRRQSQSATA